VYLGCGKGKYMTKMHQVEMHLENVAAVTDACNVLAV